MIKEFEASHGTVTDLWDMHLAGKETSLNPLGLAEALMGALQHAGALEGGKSKEKMFRYTKQLRLALHNTFRAGEGTRDMAGPEGSTTEQFIDKVGAKLTEYIKAEQVEDTSLNELPIMKPEVAKKKLELVDKEALENMFKQVPRGSFFCCCFLLFFLLLLPL